MSSNRLRLNPSKTELIWLGSSRRLHHGSSSRMRVSDVDLRPVDCVRGPGVLIDSRMTLARHVNHISGVCLFQLRQLRIIRRSLTSDTAHALVRALIHTRIDYCNGLLAFCPHYLTDKLILEVEPTTVRPTNQNKDTGSTRFLLRLVCRVELAPGGLARSRTLAPLLQNKTEISLFFIVD